MPDPKAYEPRLGRAAGRQFKKLSTDEQTHIRQALARACATLAKPGARGGKSLKKIKGRHDDFSRLRVGDLRVMFEIRDADAVLMVLGIVNRRDLERWLRSN